MKTVIPIFLLSVLLIGFNPIAEGNNLRITNVAVNQTTKIVTFDISWDNSWRLAGAPTNWDAIWVFVKFRDCAATAATAFTHGALSATKANHTFGASLEPMTTPCTASTGGCGGADVTGSAVQGATLDFTEGVLLRRSAVGSGTTSQTSVALNITNLPAAGTTITTYVKGIEMVYCPQGDFALGDGDGAGGGVSPTRTGFQNSGATCNSTPMMITSAYETAAQTFYICLATTAAVPAAWPKGQYGFYIMKYEITEGLYVEFLNTIGGVAQAARYLGNVGSSRNQAQAGAALNTYTTPRPDRAQNFFAWADYSAFLDWACLRPLCETEYEKACRGTTTYTPSEWAWGTATGTGSNGGTFTAPGAENGTEIFSLPVGANCAIGGASNFTNGDGGQGPVRAGIFATATSTRVTSGAGYFGAMELTGNVLEMVVGMHGTGASNVYTRTWGDGIVDPADGNHNVATWPAFNVVIANNSVNNLVGWRGGYWGDAANHSAVSSRHYIYANAGATSRNGAVGGRGVR